MEYAIKKYSFFLLLMICTHLIGQQSFEIPIRNSSFEDVPKQGIYSFNIDGWYDCGPIRFAGESPPDIHPNNFWNVNIAPSHGNTYLGMVVRDNDTYEGISQILSKPLESGKCYSLNIDLARSPIYLSLSRMTNVQTNYITPAVMRIWGGNGLCSDRELLAESVPITHSDWKTYDFKFKPKFQHSAILIEVYYKTPVFMPYSGHLLLDNLSNIKIEPCDPNQKKDIAEVTPTKPKDNKLPPHKQGRIDETKKPPKQDTAVNTVNDLPKKKILTDLDVKKVKAGSTVEIKNLYFKADIAEINNNSFEVLDEIAQFLKENPKISIEIGGHTNGTPPHSYCDKLSNDRAKAVYDYLVDKGVKKEKLSYKGYGKRRRIASDTTAEGRTKNQRVEIKILSLG